MKWPKLSRRAWLRVVFYSTPLLAVAHARWVEPAWVKVRRLRFAPGRPTHRLVHFTDLHHRGDQPYLQSVVRKINALAPDLVRFTGDIIEDGEFLPEALELLRGVKAPLYGVPGNHDYWSGVDFKPIAECFASTGGRWLLDDSVLTRDGQMNVLGSNAKRAPKLQPRAGVKDVLLVHYPAWADRLGDRKFDLILAGHSHGGQVRLPFYGPLVLPFLVEQYDVGLFRTPSGPLYVNPGIGYFYLNVRFNCRPEITVVEI
ncbi:MAG: metallophosphoesterase [Verrucomicrobia bacterium]|nr:metallophosphoesterase [Verrucomicrobiota bacterium]